MLNHLINTLAHRLRIARYGQIADHSPLADLYAQSLPDPAQKFLDTEFMVIDCEMNGLNPQRDELLSIGWVKIRGGKIKSNSAQHIIINAQKGAGKSALLHGLDNYTLEQQGNADAETLALLGYKARGCILVFHHAPIDLAFLQATAMRTFGCPIPAPYIDTMEIERKKMIRRDKTGRLQLQECRARYGLAPYAQHNALNDALATAELFLAQLRHNDKPENLKLADLPVKYA